MFQSSTQTATERSLAAGQEPDALAEVRAMARAVVAAAADYNAAESLLRSRIKSRGDDFEDEVRAALFDSFLRDLVREAGRSARVSASRSAWRIPESAGEGIAARLNNDKSLYDFPLPGGKRLGDATAEEVKAAAQHYRSASKASAQRAAFLDAVAKKMARTKKTGAVKLALTADELATLYTKEATQ